ncbi:hybrid sensor histidine kinase/response regulator [Candidatus Uabimicrobium amorphum]|uniref:histidine kinase n=1 Tax=Uabimicrobium amorphum TaxID=2596890 RepID=A0A5S9F1G3_UABAM|nr:response regulator [Candidatus Uabimicrobium amorphum]BBM82388.1 histidine kinase [Candidatus Uabimicrobium amorphum]
MQKEQSLELYDEQAYSLNIYEKSYHRNSQFVDKMFVYLMVFQYAFCLFLAVVVSPKTWVGSESSFHIHLWSAFIFGGIFTVFPVFLAYFYSGKAITRHIIGISQVLISALIIHLTGGRIESHFHVFGSLAFLAFYRDWKVLVSASAVVALDHFIRGVYFPQSVFGIITASNWRWVEHTAWVVFEDIFLIYSCVRSCKEMREIANKQANYESLNHKLWQNEKILQKSNWLKSNIAKLNEEIFAQNNITNFADACLEFFHFHTKSLMAAFYHREGNHFDLIATQAFDRKNLPARFTFGETLLGEVVKKGKLMVLEDEDRLKINTGVGLITPKKVMYIPIIFEEEINALIVIATLEDYKKQEFIELAAEKISLRLQNLMSTRKTEMLAQTLSEQNRKIQKSKEVLQQKNKELEEASRHKSEFLANMSHELRTPLNAMIGYTALTVKKLQGKVEERNIRNLKKAEKSAKSLLQLINDVLDFSKIEAGKTQTHRSRISISNVIEECLDTLEGLAQSKSITLNWIQRGENFQEIDSDFTKLKQILTNIIGNAIKFTEQGGITINVIHLSDALKVTISDTGCGIPASTIENIFESFKQVDSTTKKRFGGTGLGLAITKKFCELLDIDISVESEEKQGTTFYLIVPLWQEPSTENNVVEEQKVFATNGDVYTPEERGNVSVEKRFVLAKNKAYVPCIVSPKSFDSLQRCLKDLPFFLELCDLEHCLNSQNIWAIVAEPKLSGIEALRTLKEHATTKHVPVILYSGEDEVPKFCAQINHWVQSGKEKDFLEALIQANSHQRGDILIVEDDVDTAEMYKSTLESVKFRCKIAKNGKEALDYVSACHNFQLIILDLLLPGMDGFEFLAKLQEDTHLRKIPIVIVTGKDLTQDEKFIIEEGSSMLLNKGNFEYSDFECYVQEVAQTFRLARSRSVLVVDDNDENLDLISSLLSMSGYSVSKASSGLNIVEKVVRENPDVVLMDLAMPEVDGFEATRKIKQNPSTANTTVIACSAFHTHDFKKRAYAAGCEGYITKPIEPYELIEQIQKYTLASKIAYI